MLQRYLYVIYTISYRAGRIRLSYE